MSNPNRKRSKSAPGSISKRKGDARKSLSDAVQQSSLQKSQAKDPAPVTPSDPRDLAAKTPIATPARRKSLGDEPTRRHDIAVRGNRLSNSTPKSSSPQDTESTPSLPPTISPLSQTLAQQSEGWQFLQQSIGKLQSEIDELSKQHRVGNLKRTLATLSEQVDYMRSLYRPDSNLGTSLPYSLSVVGEVFLQDLNNQLNDLHNAIDLISSATAPLHVTAAALSANLRSLENDIGNAAKSLPGNIADKLRQEAELIRRSLANLNTGQDAWTNDLVMQLQALQVRTRNLSSQLDQARDAQAQREIVHRDAQIPWAQTWSKLRDVRILLQNLYETFGKTLVSVYGSDLEKAVETISNALVGAGGVPDDQWFVTCCQKQVEALYQQMEQVNITLEKLQGSSNLQQKTLILRTTPMKLLSLLGGAEGSLPNGSAAKSACTALKQLCQGQVDDADATLMVLRDNKGIDSPQSQNSYQQLEVGKQASNRALATLMSSLNVVPILVMPPQDFLHIFRLLSFLFEAMGGNLAPGVAEQQRNKCLTQLLNALPEDTSLLTYKTYATQGLAVLELAHDWLPNDSFLKVASTLTRNFEYAGEVVVGMTDLTFLPPIIAKLMRAPFTGTPVCTAAIKSIAVVTMQKIAAADLPSLITLFAALGPMLGTVLTAEVAEATAIELINRSVNFPQHTQPEAVNLCTQIQRLPLPDALKGSLLGSYLSQYLLHYSAFSQRPTLQEITSDLGFLQNYVHNTCPVLDGLACQAYINAIPGQLDISCIAIVRLCLRLGPGTDPLIDALASRHRQEQPFHHKNGNVTCMVIEIPKLRRLADPRSAVCSDILFAAPPDIRYASGVEGSATVRVVVDYTAQSGQLLLGFDEENHSGKGHHTAINSMIKGHENATRARRITVVNTMADLRQALRSGAGWVQLNNPLLMLTAFNV